MKKRLMAIILVLAFTQAGCLSYISFKHPKLGKAKYFRVGDQQLVGLNIKAGENIGLELEGQKSDAAVMSDALNAVIPLIPKVIP